MNLLLPKYSASAASIFEHIALAANCINELETKLIIDFSPKMANINVAHIALGNSQKRVDPFSFDHLASVIAKQL